MFIYYSQGHLNDNEALVELLKFNIEISSMIYDDMYSMQHILTVQSYYAASTYI